MPPVSCPSLCLAVISYTDPPRNMRKRPRAFLLFMSVERQHYGCAGQWRFSWCVIKSRANVAGGSFPLAWFFEVQRRNTDPIWAFRDIALFGHRFFRIDAAFGWCGKVGNVVLPCAHVIRNRTAITWTLQNRCPELESKNLFY